MVKHLSKFLTVTACLLTVSIGTYAQKTAEATVKMTYVDYDNPDTAYGEIAEGESALAGYNKISSGYVAFGYSGWGVNYVTYLQVDASSIGSDVIISSVTLTADFSGSTDSKRTTTWGAGYNTSTWSDELTYNTADLSITTVGEEVTTSSKSATTFNSLSIDITDAFTDDDDLVATILIYETSAAGGYIQNPEVEVVYYSADDASTYTVKYVDSEGNELQDAATYTGLIGDDASITDDDEEAIWVDDVKYVYSSDDSDGQTIAEDGSTVVTITFVVADIYSYTLTGSAGGNTFEIGTGSVYAGETGEIPFSTYTVVDEELYSTSNDNSNYYYIAQITPTYDGYEKTISYSDASLSNVIFYSEGEDLEGMTASTDVIPTYRCSAGTIGYATEAITVTTLEAGKYYIVAGTFQCSDANLESVEFTFSINDETVGSVSHVTYSTWPIAYTTDEFEVTSSSELVLDAFDGAARIGVDYLYIVQTEEYESTGIQNVATESTDGSYYSLQGIKVENPAKGLYIQNGKKVILK